MRQIVNIKSPEIEALPKGAVMYIGRGSVLGNPFRIGMDGDRVEVINLYRNYLYERINNGDQDIILTLKGIKPDALLGCFCHPLPCHGQVVLEAIDYVNQLAAPVLSGMYYAGIGSRETPPDILELATRIARRLSVLGFTLRSGGAVGADQAFSDGAASQQVFLPWAGYNNLHSDYIGPSEKSKGIAKILHPGWDYLSQGVKKLMARNTHQIMGPNCDSLSRFVVCYTKDGCETGYDRTKMTGGTGQAIDLASRLGIPVFNLKNKDALQRLGALIKSIEQENEADDSIRFTQ